MDGCHPGSSNYSSTSRAYQIPVSLAVAALTTKKCKATVPYLYGGDSFLDQSAGPFPWNQTSRRRQTSRDAIAAGPRYMMHPRHHTLCVPATWQQQYNHHHHSRVYVPALPEAPPFARTSAARGGEAVLPRGRSARTCFDVFLFSCRRQKDTCKVQVTPKPGKGNTEVHPQSFHSIRRNYCLRRQRGHPVPEESIWQRRKESKDIMILQEINNTRALELPVSCLLSPQTHGLSLCLSVSLPPVSGLQKPLFSPATLIYAPPKETIW